MSNPISFIKKMVYMDPNNPLQFARSIIIIGAMGSGMIGLGLGTYTYVFASRRIFYNLSRVHAIILSSSVPLSYYNPLICFGVMPYSIGFLMPMGYVKCYPIAYKTVKWIWR